MTVRIGINGFGRIGRNYLRAARSLGADIDIVAVNDLTSAETLAHLLRYDSTHGPFDSEIAVHDSTIVLDSGPIAVLAERDPKALPWDKLGVEVVVESTGLFTTRATAGTHLEAGASRVIVSAPASDVDATFVVGVNDGEFDPTKDFVVSNASCTTNCFVPMVKVLDDAFTVESGLMTTVHAFTNDQNLLDLPHKDLRRARAAAINIVPVSTGAARATGLVLPSMKGRLDSTGLRVPVPDGSITDFTAVIPGIGVGGRGQRGLRRRRLHRAAVEGAGVHRGPHRVVRHRRQSGVVHLRRRTDHGHAFGVGDHSGQGAGLVRQRVGIRQPTGGSVTDRRRLWFLIGRGGIMEGTRGDDGMSSDRANPLLEDCRCLATSPIWTGPASWCGWTSTCRSDPVPASRPWWPTTSASVPRCPPWSTCWPKGPGHRLHPSRTPVGRSRHSLRPGPGA